MAATACGGLGNRAPFDASRKSCTAATAQTRLDDLFDCSLRSERESSFKASVTTVCAIIFERPWIDDATTPEGQPGLALEPGNGLD